MRAGSLLHAEFESTARYAQRGRHIGRALYEHVLDYAKKSGCYNVTLNVWTLNPTAQKFYESCGMKPQKIGMETVL